jgi:hypothetical protein
VDPAAPVRAPGGTVIVVVGDVDPEHLLEVSSPLISSQSRHSARTERIQRSA